MKKLGVELLIGFMTVALLGIIGIQAYWLNNAYQTKRTQFGVQVNDAIHDVAKKLEQRENLSQLLQKATLTGDTSNVNLIKSVQGGHKATILVTQNPHGGSTIEEKIVYSSKPTDKTQKKRITRIVSLSNSEHGHLSSKEEMTMRINDSSKVTIHSENTRIKVKLDRLKNFEEKLIWEIFGQNNSGSKKTSVTTIDSLLTIALQNNNIRIPHYMGISNGDTNINCPPMYKNKEQFIKTSSHKALLYPNDILANPTQLLVWFPDEQQHLLSSVGFMFGASFLFTLAIIICFAVTLRIIFQQKKLSEIRNDFINNMTHEFKTPLATISLAADTILSPVVIASQENIKTYSQIIKTESKRLQNHVETILQTALSDTKESSQVLEPCDIHHLIQKASEGLQLQVAQSNGNIELHLDALEHEVMGQPTHLGNVIFNLLDNAHKYSPNQPQIIVKTDNKGNTILISISDNGIGIPKEEQKLIFDKFYRVHTGNVHNVKGFGLGLSYAKAVVEKYGGRITINSAPHQGSTFKIELPLHKQH